MSQPMRVWGRLSISSLNATMPSSRRLISTAAPGQTVAVLYQAVPPPIINGVTKPLKPGGYQDSGADIAYVLQKHGYNIVTPLSSPDPAKDEGWCFPDTEEGILSALSHGADTVWANTILFSSHPLQTSTKIPGWIRLIGQPPNLVQKYDDKALTNDLLRGKGRFTFPKAWVLSARNEPSQTNAIFQRFTFPVVAKPIRGRGSHGVKVCVDEDTLRNHAAKLFKESPEIIIEQFLVSEEATVTVMPPSFKPSPSPRPRSLATPTPYRLPSFSKYYSLPIVTRFNHQDGIAPYNGIVAVTHNSRVITPAEYASDPAYDTISRECEAAAEILGTTAPIRIDVRRVSAENGAKFAMFDVNMKPNATGPGRPGRGDQSSLTALVAQALGWDYAKYLEVCLKGGKELGMLRRWV